jgi:hypothetical protein
MYANTMRLSVRHGKNEALLAVLPLVGAIRTVRYERPCQVVFVENGVELIISPIDEDLVAPGWPSLGSLLRDLVDLDIESFACSACAEYRTKSPKSESFIRIHWVPPSDLRLPLHHCQGAVEKQRVIPVELRRRDQSEFDKRVGKRTVGAEDNG